MKISKKLVITFGLFLILSSIGYAAQEVNINVSYNGIKIVVNGTEVPLGKDGSGKQIEPFIYNGTTYLPVRSVAEVLGKDVEWDPSTQTVFLNDKGVKTNETEKILTETVEMFSGEYSDVINKKSIYKEESLAGKKYKNGVKFWTYLTNNVGTASFNLEGKYTVMTGLLGADQEGSIMNVKFIGNGRLLKEYKIVTGELPIDVKLDVSGVKLFRIECQNEDGHGEITSFLDVKIK